jgi:hypothetical protein
VLAGWSMRKGIDYKETFSPTVRQDSLKVVLAIAAQRNYNILQFDYKTAYLNSKMKELVYMEIPPGFDIKRLIQISKKKKKSNDISYDEYQRSPQNFVLRVDKAIYGTPQAGRYWNEDISKFLTSLGYTAFEKDKCIFMKKFSDNNLSIIALYVDDLIVIGPHDERTESLKTKLGEKYQVKCLGVINEFLGISFKMDSGVLSMNLEKYIDKMLTKFKMTECKPVSNPGDKSVSLNRDQCPKTDEEQRAMKNVPYRELIGSLLFATTTLFPEINCAVSMLSEFLNNPGKIHWREAKRVLQYLKSVKKRCLIFRPSKHFKLHGYVDSDWGSNLDNRRSRSGYVFKLGRCIISWSSTLQQSVAQSSAEAELMAATHATKQAIYLRDLLKFLDYEQSEATVLFEDNQACIRLSINPEFHKRTKHIEIREFYVREKVNSSEVKLIYIKTTENIADIFTKILPTNVFSYLVAKMYEVYITKA